MREGRRERVREALPSGRPDDQRGLLHDVRNELAAMAAGLAALSLETDLGPRAGARVEVLRRQVHETIAILHANLTNAPRESPVEIHSFLDQLAAAVTSGRGVTVEAQAPLVTVLVDLAALRRIVLNLLDNAVRAAGDGGRVRLRAELAASVLTLDVRDDGPGFRAPPRASTSLGLSIAETLASEAGGRLQILLGEATGACVRVQIPVRCVS